MMVRKLTRFGNSLALVIDPALLNRLDIDSDTKLDITTDGEALIISPVREEAKDRTKGAKPGPKYRSRKSRGR